MEKALLICHESLSLRDKMMKKFFENSFCSFYKFLGFLFLKTYMMGHFIVLKCFIKWVGFIKMPPKCHISEFCDSYRQ